MIDVLVVDDSPTMRALIGSVLHMAPDIRVVGEAADPLEARAAIKALSPDVVTLDIEMPNMNGLDFLEKIMRLRPTPVVMVSSLTRQGTAAAVRALEIGAVDCVGKPRGTIGDFDDLVGKVRAAACAKLRPFAGGQATPALLAAQVAAYRPGREVVAVGSSTGGVEALITLLSGLPLDCPAILITQHMPATFTRSFAARLDRLCGARVEEASDGAPVQPGRIYLAPGARAHLELGRGSGGMVCRLLEAPPVNGHRPSVDVLFHSMARVAGRGAVGVILTGMGGDGAAGLLAMRKAGARTLGQDEASSIVYGMPKVAFDLGAVEQQGSPERLARHILDLTNRPEQRRAACLLPHN